MRIWFTATLVAMWWCASWSSALAADIRVMAAGSLKESFTAIFADYTSQYGASFTPVWGPSGVLRERLRNGEAFDIFASAALPHAQALTDSGISGPSVMFARNSLCVVTDAARPIEAGNLIETLLRPDVRIGTSTPVSDPSGDYTWEMFHKIDAMHPGAFATLSGKAQQLVGGPNSPAAVNGRSPLLAALDEHRIDLFIGYCSGTQQLLHDPARYKSISLPPELSAGPEYGLTVSRHAQTGASDFAIYLLSPPAQKQLQAFGFVPVALPAGR
jgi:molybdate transport system substrate-binding protein